MFANAPLIIVRLVCNNIYIPSVKKFAVFCKEFDIIEAFFLVVTRGSNVNLVVLVFVGEGYCYAFLI